MTLKVGYQKGKEKKVDISVREEKTNYKALVSLVLIIAVLLAHIPILYAYEAHIINVTARICHKSETRTIGYWKNHLEVAAPYLPITLGEVDDGYYYKVVDGPANAEVVFLNANAKDMRIKLRAQLLAMKLNILHFGIGDYEVEEWGDLYGLVAEADHRLTDPSYTREQVEEIKNALDDINNMHLLRVCLDKTLLPQVAVLDPNGGEEWQIVDSAYAVPGLGMYHIRWEAINPGGDSDDLLIDIWYCSDSGNNCFHPIIQGTENDGEEWWTIPDDQAFETKGMESRIKIIAIDKDNILRVGYDLSDENFCPKKLSRSDIEAMLGIEPVLEPLLTTATSQEEPVIEEIMPEDPVIEEPVVEEVIAEESLIIQDSVEEPVIEVIEEPVVEEPPAEEPLPEPPVEEPIEEPAAEIPVTDESPIILEEPLPEPTEEPSVIEEPLPEVIEEDIIE